MGRVLLVCRLVARGLRHRPAEAALLLLAIATAATTLTLGLALHGVTSQPYQQTRAATAGPDEVAAAWPSPPPGPRIAVSGVPHGGTLASLAALAHARGVTGHTGPYPVASPVLRVGGRTDAVIAIGRGQAPAPIDQPKLTQGSWVRAGGVVVERAFADALGIRAGDRITLNGRSFRVAGIAVTAAIPPYPHAGFLQASLAYPDPGVIWLTQTDARSLATPAQPLFYIMNLKLADPATADAFARSHDNTPSVRPHDEGPGVISWQSISRLDAKLVQNEQGALLVGSWLLGLLAVASVTVIAGGRMAEQTRRVGLLKAVGGTPRLVAAVLLAEYLVLALLAAAVGLAAGRRAAPLLTSPGAGLVGTAGTPPITPATVALVAAVALAVAVAASLVPSLRAARTSTVRALADPARAPRRRAWLIALSARLPVPLLLGLRVAARRPRRMALNAISIAVTVGGIVTVLIAHASITLGVSSGLDNPKTDRLDQVMLVITIMLVALAAVNAIFITWATVLDARRSSALARALGATPRQVTAGLSAAQALPALAGAIAGIPAGIELYASVRNGGAITNPPAWWFAAVVLGTLLTVAGLSAIPARIGARRPVAEILQSELT